MLVGDEQAAPVLSYTCQHCRATLFCLLLLMQAVQRDFGVNAGEIRRVLGLWQVGGLHECEAAFSVPHVSTYREHHVDGAGR